MKKFKFPVSAALFSLFLAVSAGAFAQGPPPAPAAADPDVVFRWAFVARTPAVGNQAMRPITKDTTLVSGDELKLMVELRKRCFVYVFHYNARDGVKLLFPYSIRQFEADYRPMQKYYVPRGDSWFRLDDDPGLESFYLIGSPQRIEPLEKAYLDHEAAPQSDRAATARVVLDLIRTLRKEHRELAAPAEKPVPIGGAVRGITPAQEPNGVDVASFADEVASTGFVARAYTIEHK